ncbi:iron complex transport system ATP-binding protein [Gammaproteobacteria bacterium]
MPGVTLLEARGLTVEVADYTVCRGLDLALYPGECWGMLGVNGAGKTTLLHTLAGLHPARTGSVLLDGLSRTQLGRRGWAQRLGVVFQDESDPFPSTVLESTLIGRHPHLGRFGWETESDYALAREALAAMDLVALEQRETVTLSGGERQRLRMAAFLTQDTPIGLLDEPTNHLDPAHQMRLFSLLVARAHARAGTLLMALHDVNLVARFCDHCLLLYGNGDTTAGPVTEVLTVASLQRLYRHPLVAVNAPWGQGWLPA